VQSLVRAFALLEAMGAARAEVGIGDLATRVQLHVSTAHRLLATLVSLGYVRQNPGTGRYGLGARALHFAEAYLEQSDLRDAARPVLERLSRETGETANLVVLDGHEVLYLDKAESPQNLRIFSRIGRRAPLHATAAGKVLLACRPAEEVSRLLGRGALERLTPRTLTGLTELRLELAETRAQGYAVDRGECEEGAHCIAAPVSAATGEVLAAISLSGPSIRMSGRRVREIVPAVVAAAHAVSAALGYRAGMSISRAVGGRDPAPREVRSDRREVREDATARPGQWALGSRVRRR
jgi:IclR family acetate operon transcriptional repressor